MDYYPDGDISQPGVLFDIRSYYANNNGAYARVPALQSLGYGALSTGPCVGSAIVKNLAGTAKWYAGSTAYPYQANGSGGWTDRSGGVNSVATTWDFCAFGDNVIAANGSTQLLAATTGNFSTITGSPTGAIVVFAHANAVVALGSTSDKASWARSKTGDHTTWTPAANNDADAGTLYGGIGGPITAGCSWENLAIAWKSRAMYAATYAGNADPSQDVLRWQMVSSDVGCVAQWAWIATEIGLIFVSERDIMLFNGNRPVSIADKVRKKFVSEGNGKREKTFLTLDEANNQVYIWRGSVSGSWCDTAMIYNYKNGKWGHLIDLSDATGLTLGDPKIPVRGANYQDLVTIGGINTNDSQIANVFIDETDERALNLAGSSYLDSIGDGFIRTGFIGRPDKNTRLMRFRLTTDAYSTISDGYTAQVILYDEEMNVLSTVTAASGGVFFDVCKEARWFEIQITGQSTETGNIRSIVLEMIDPETNKGFTQEI